MPTYSYVCKTCGHRFDAHQSFTDDALTTCPQCQGQLRKLFSSVGVVFKGSGFYRTDSRSSASIPAGASKPTPAKTAGESASTPVASSASSSSSAAKSA